MLSWLILSCWTASFVALSYGTKLVVQSLPSLSEGPRAICVFLLHSPWAYVLPWLYASCMVLYLAAMRLMPLSVAGPVVTVLGAVSTFILGAAVFHETVTMPRMTGVALCLAGMALLCGTR
jgi:multidrug transporter EmrE-like cation transporter